MKNQLNKYLESSVHIDCDHSAIIQQADFLAANSKSPADTVKKCFEWVRDEIHHTADYKENIITCTASDVLAAGTGYCFAKSHLLAALLRARKIPAGLCYQRLSRDNNGPPFCLHGLNAVYLAEVGWYRVDPRGNKPGIDTQFCPPTEKLAYKIQYSGEADLPEIWAEPLPSVVDTLQTCDTYIDVWKNLPDVDLINTK